MWLLILIGVAYVAGVVWIVYKTPEKWKSTVSILITIVTILSEVPVTDQVSAVLEQHSYHNNRVVVDSLQASENRILDSLRASENRIMTLMQQIQEREARLDSKIETLQKGISVLQDSVHDHRHFDSVNKTLNTRFSYIDGWLKDIIKEGAPR